MRVSSIAPLEVIISTISSRLADDFCFSACSRLFLDRTFGSASPPLSQTGLKARGQGHSIPSGSEFLVSKPIEKVENDHKGSIGVKAFSLHVRPCVKSLI